MAGSFWDFLPAALTIGASLYGTSQASKANNKAADTMAGAQKSGTAAQLAGIEAAKKQIAIDQAAASPGLLAEQAVINRGSALTPEQELQVADSREQALNALKGSSLRGSARATSAIVADTDQRVRDNLMQQNLNRADTAAAGLSGQYFNAGNSLANNATNAGTVASQGLVNTGDINAANSIGQGKLTGQAIGDVGALISDNVKNNLQQTRNSTYAPVAGLKDKIIWNDGAPS